MVSARTWYFFNSDTLTENVIVLYSRLNSLMTTFRFAEGEQESPLPISSSDPSKLNLDDDILESDRGPKRIFNVNLKQVRYGEARMAESAGLGLKYMRNDVRFYLLTVILSDLSVHETLLYTFEPTRDESNDDQPQDLAVEVPNWQRKVVRRGVRSKRMVDEDDDVYDNFIVPDGTEIGSKPRLSRIYRPPRVGENRITPSLQTGSHNEIAEDPWTVDNTLVYRALAQTSPEGEPAGGNTDIVSILDNVQDMLNEDPLSADNPLGTLSVSL